MVLHLLFSPRYGEYQHGMNCMTSSDPVETMTLPQEMFQGMVEVARIELASKIKLLHLIHAYRLAWASSELASGSSGNLPSACISPIRPTTLPRKLKNCGESS